MAPEDPIDIDADHEEREGESDEQDEQDLEQGLAADEIVRIHEVVEAGEEVDQELAGLPQPEVEDQQLQRNGVEADGIQFHADPGDPAEREPLQVLTDEVRQMRQLVQSVHDGPRLLGYRVKYGLVFFGILSGAVTIGHLIYDLKVTVDGSGTGPVGVANLTNSTDIATVKRFWLKNSEAEFWESPASFVEKEKPRPFHEQLIFSQMTLDLANRIAPAHGWVWQTRADKSGLIEKLARLISDKGLAAAYRLLPAITYSGQPLPRPIAAELISLALTRWWVEYA
jgi:hypothetical protein